eukprot:COSAG01_NODE_657_length_14457_cov_99.379649_15_plen_234_part_00
MRRQAFRRAGASPFTVLQVLSMSAAVVSRDSQAYLRLPRRHEASQWRSPAMQPGVYHAPRRSTTEWAVLRTCQCDTAHEYRCGRGEERAGHCRNGVEMWSIVLMCWRSIPSRSHQLSDSWFCSHTEAGSGRANSRRACAYTCFGKPGSMSQSISQSVKAALALTPAPPPPPLPRARAPHPNPGVAAALVACGGGGSGGGTPPSPVRIRGVATGCCSALSPQVHGMHAEAPPSQ